MARWYGLPVAAVVLPLLQVPLLLLVLFLMWLSCLHLIL
jgi:hypothetical protein